jgi:hypothetical protein
MMWFRPPETIKFDLWNKSTRRSVERSAVVIRRPSGMIKRARARAKAARRSKAVAE